MAEEGGDFDSWEDQADSGLFDKRLDEMSVEIQQTEKKKILTRGPVVVSDESGSTQYQPQVRILKRDAKAPPPETTPVMSSSSKTNKSLQQREAEYAEARMRIFGCVTPEEEEEEGEEEPPNSNGNDCDDKNNSSSVVIQGVPQIFKAANNSIVPVIRQPRGPDGTIGFNKSDHT